MKRIRKILLLLTGIALMNVSAVCQDSVLSVQASETETKTETETETEAAPKLAGLQKKNGSYYFYEDGKPVTNTWKTIKDKKTKKSYKYYFGANGKAYAAKNVVKTERYTQNVVVKKIGKYYYGFDRLGHMVKNGYYNNPFKLDKNGNSTTYYFDKKGRRNAAKSNAITKAGKYEKNAKTLRKILGKPIKTKKMNSCSPIPGKDYKLVYKNIYVTIHRNTDGSEFVYGIFPM